MGQLEGESCSKISSGHFFHSTFIDFLTGHQKLGIIWEKRVFLKLKLSKNANNKKHPPKLMLLNDKNKWHYRSRHFLMNCFKVSKSTIKRMFDYNWFSRKSLLPVDTCPQKSTTHWGHANQHFVYIFHTQHYQYTNRYLKEAEQDGSFNCGKNLHRISIFYFCCGLHHKCSTVLDFSSYCHFR